MSVGEGAQSTLQASFDGRRLRLSRATLADPDAAVLDAVGIWRRVRAGDRVRSISTKISGSLLTEGGYQLLTEAGDVIAYEAV